MKEFHMYCDGSSTGKVGVGGWGYLILELCEDEDGNQIDTQLQQDSGGENKTTNNKMELQAAIEGLKWFTTYKDEHLSATDKYIIKVHSDSQYVINGITKWIKGWIKNKWLTYLKKPVKNQEYWEELNELNVDLNTEWIWVKAHVGIEYNEMVDQLAKDAKNELA